MVPRRLHFFDGTYHCQMGPSDIDQALTRAEAAVKAGDGLAGTGFWPAVAEMKKNPTLLQGHAERVAGIDQQAFRNWALLVIPQGAGTALAWLAVAVGGVLVGLAYSFEDWPAIVMFLAGFGVIFVATHGLAHLVVGRLVGIRFTAWFVGTIGRPQPGVKVDYSSYLSTAPKRRAWMHASGAIVSKIVPFALIVPAVAAGLPAWVVWALVLVGVVSVITDVLWSTTKSDWKKFRREMAFAQTYRSG